MDFATLLPMLLTGAGTGLSCGVSCGACGNPMVNVFLAGYLFTHTDKMKKSLVSFGGYHLGRAVSVSVLCVIISWFGEQIVDEQGNLFGLNLHKIVYILMLFFVTVLIVQWLWKQKRKGQASCGQACSRYKRKNQAHGIAAAQKSQKFFTMFLYGAVSGMSPCASLLVVLTYASALNIWQAVLVGLSFSLANSLIPLLLLTALTGLLSEQMHKEIPEKIRYFQLGTMIIFAIALVKNLLSMR